MKPGQKTVFLALVVLASLTTVAAGAGSDFSVYENSNYNIRFQYPAEWKVLEGFMGTVVAFASPGKRQ
ncbi:MAG: hypothetical protein P4N41_16975 [Negativicutes bacterium]|nr:hypothetical protein [Negativicutes bacterium]